MPGAVALSRDIAVIPRGIGTLSRITHNTGLDATGNAQRRAREDLPPSDQRSGMPEPEHPRSGGDHSDDTNEGAAFGVPLDEDVPAGQSADDQHDEGEQESAGPATDAVGDEVADEIGVRGLHGAQHRAEFELGHAYEDAW